MLDGALVLLGREGPAAEGLRWAQLGGRRSAERPAEGARRSACSTASELFRIFGDPGVSAPAQAGARSPTPRVHGPDPNCVASTLADMAEMLAVDGDFDEARRLQREALALRRSLGTPLRDRPRARELGAWSSSRPGTSHGARELSEEALTFVEEPRVLSSLAVGPAHGGRVRASRGDRSPAAAPLLRRALRLHRGAGLSRGLPGALAGDRRRETRVVPPRGPAARRVGAPAAREWALPRWDPARLRAHGREPTSDARRRAFRGSLDSGRRAVRGRSRCRSPLVA